MRGDRPIRFPWTVRRRAHPPRLRPLTASLLALPLALLLGAAGCGSDSPAAQDEDDVLFGFDVGSDLADVELGGGLAVGELCGADEDCLSSRCEAFGDQRYCTEECETLCNAEEVVCWDGLCTPTDYCDDSAGEPGEGPGCPGSACQSCDPDGGACVQEGDTFSCACRPGWQGDGLTCTDVDECADALDTCAEDAECANTEGGFTCQCLPGFEGDGTACGDVDECTLALDDCAENADCTNTAGSFDCTCRDGFTGEGSACTDINECEGANDCDTNATCANIPGGYDCHCRGGFTGDGTTCTDINECEGTNDCDPNADCDNTTGGYDCNCRGGFTGDGTTCTDVNECEGTNDCDTNADCDNTTGGYDCTCRGGFTGDGTTCADVNECAGTNDCDPNADCDNTTGGYDCNCRDGFTGDGTTCTDVNECAGTNDCDPNADCDNTTGGYDCNCRDGYEGDGLTCTLITYGLTGDLTAESPGLWADGSWASSCQEYRYPELPYLYEGTAVDGWYRLGVPTEGGDDRPVGVWCDMTTDGGGWTAIDVATADAFGASIENLLGSVCQIVDGHPGGVAAGDVLCRYEVALPFVFNALRLDGVVIEALSSDPNIADLSYDTGNWGELGCGGLRGDVRWGSPAHPAPVLSLGAWLGVAACTAGPSFTDGTLLDWDGAEATTTPDTVLRLELGELGGEVEGWRWSAGRVYLRDEWVVVGSLTAEDPGHWEDDTAAASCFEYRYPSGPYAYFGSTGDGYYTIQPSPEGPSANVFCDMTTDGGGWTAIDPETAAALGAAFTTLAGAKCNLVEGLYPEAYGTGTTECRYDIDLGFPFNTIRTDNVEITARAGADQLSDLTDSGTAWGSATCSNRGDVRLGAASADGAVLSLGAAYGADSCGDGGGFAEGTTLAWDGDAADLPGDATVLRLELGEQGTETEGWRWSGGRILVRRAFALTGLLDTSDPGRFEDGHLASSCLDYLDPSGPYAYSGVVGDGTYRIDWDGRGGEASADVACDMTTDGGGFTGITLDLARNRLGGVLASPGGGQQPTVLELDAQNRPRSQDAGGDHTATYTFEIPFGYTSFHLADYELKAFAGAGHVSEISTATFQQTAWSLANGGANGDVSFGDANAAGPVTSYAAQGTTFSSLDATLAWPAPGTVFAIAAPSALFRIGWGEAGSQVEGWYPWWTGTIYVR